MNDAILPILTDLLRQQGAGLCGEPRRLRALLLDLAPDHRRETNLLVQAAEQQVALEIAGLAGQRLDALQYGRLVKLLLDEYSLTDDAAHWTVRVWARALGKEPPPRARPAVSAPSVSPQAGGRQPAQPPTASRAGAPVVLQGHIWPVTAVIWSPDGRTVASASEDRTLMLWDGARGTALGTLKGHNDGVTSLAWSPDGRTLASGAEDRTVRLWSATSQQLLETIKVVIGKAYSLAWSPDGQMLACACRDDGIWLWDVARRAPRRALPHRGVRTVAWSPDGRSLASAGDDRSVKIWQVERERVVHSLEGHTSYVTGLSWSPDGLRLASGSDDMSIRVWGTAIGRLLRILKGHTRSVGCLAWSPDNATIASGSGDTTVHLWRASDGRLEETLQGHTRLVSAVAWRPDGRVLASAGSFDLTVRLWPR